MKWLITGGCGFIGRNLIAHLLARSGERHRIGVFDDLSASALADLEGLEGLPGIEVMAAEAPSASPWAVEAGRCAFILGDIRDPDLVRRWSEGADVFVHLAANTGVAPSVADPRADCATNVFGTLNCLEAARANGIARFVFASSGAPAGICAPPITETIAPRPASPYGASKLAGEGYCSAYFNAFGVPTVALRFSNVYGPYSGHKGSVVATFVRSALAGQPLTIYGDGSQTRDFVYVGDLVEAIRLAATAEGAGGEIFQIATGVETSVNRLLDLLRPKLAAAGLPELSVDFQPRRAGDVARNYADASKAKAWLGWEPLHSLGDGLDATVAWFRREFAGRAAAGARATE